MNQKILITGGAGFIGSNLSYHFLSKGYSVTIFDNFNRIGTRANLAWLKSSFPNLRVIEADIRDKRDIKRAVSGQDIIFHLAAQVAVTTSVLDPETDFEINARGTFNLLEGVRTSGSKPMVIFASTNKVYGGMDDIRIGKTKTRYTYKDFPYGISETANLDFHSPYGCSKGAADQYIRDYSRIYGIATVVLRQSCIYGPRQFGVEDQGWIAWFIIALTKGKKITVFGDGKQVRDVLYIDDLVRLFEVVVENRKKAQGEIFNVGGGYRNTLAVWSEFGPLLEELFGKKLQVQFDDWRPGDQKVYVSDIRRVKKVLGWSPKISVREGMKKLFTWIQENKHLFKD